MTAKRKPKFDVARFVDVMLETRHKLEVAIDEKGEPLGVHTTLPDPPNTRAEDKRWMAVRKEEMADPAANAKIAAELIRRGLTFTVPQAMADAQRAAVARRRREAAS